MDEAIDRSSGRLRVRRVRERSFIHSFVLGQSNLDLFFFDSFADVRARRSRRVSDEEVNDILSFFRIVHVLCGITSPWRTEETRFGPGRARGFVFFLGCLGVAFLVTIKLCLET